MNRQVDSYIPPKTSFAGGGGGIIRSLRRKYFDTLCCSIVWKNRQTDRQMRWMGGQRSDYYIAPRFAIVES